MTKPISCRWCQSLRHLVLLFGVGALCATVRTTMAQADDVPADLRDRVPIIDPNGRIPPGTLPPSMVDEKGRPVAHVHNTNMSCCAPCAQETNGDADVFKRPCFTRALAKSRKGFHAYLGLTDVEEVRIPQEGIPVEHIEGFEALLTSLLQPGFLPVAWDRANFHVPYRLKSVMELRGGITTYVGHAVDRTAVAANEVSSSDPIQGAWTVGGIEVLPRTPKVLDRPTRATIRLRLRGDDRLAFHMRPPDLDPDDPRQYDFAWEYLDRASVQQLLAKVFRVPFAKPEDLTVRCSRGEYKGVAAFDGQIISHEWAQAGGSLNAGSPTPHWWDKMRLLVTDSDPQYFCVEIVLGRDDVIPAAQP